MSVLSLPRIILNGTTAWNPDTNNNAQQLGYNKNPVTVYLEPGVEYDTFDEWLIEYNSGKGITNGDWNVFGQNQCWFDARVKGTRLPPQTPSSSSSPDPILDGVLRFQGGGPKLVDVDAYSSVTSQIFFDEFGIEAPDGVGFSGQGTSRSYSRRPFFGRNLAPLPIAGAMGVVWQATIAKADIQWGSAYQLSPALVALNEAMSRDDVLGIMLRVSSFTTLYFTEFGGGWYSRNDISKQQQLYQVLAQKYAENQPITVGNVASVFNPAKSALVGAVGLWEENELKTVPSGRAFAASAPAGQARAVSAIAAAAAAPVQLGPAEAQLNEADGFVTLDFQNTIPEMDHNNAKAYVGSFTVQANGPNGVTTIGTLSSADYDETAYNNGGGIIDIPFSGDWDNVRQGTLEVIPNPSADAPPTSTLTQLPLYADTDDRGVYLDEEGSGTITVQVYENGKIPTTRTQLRVRSNDPQAVSIDNHIVDVNSDGTATIKVTGLKPGNSLILFLPFKKGETPPTVPQSPDPTTGYASVRVLPLDSNLATLTDDQITWDFVYDNVLRPFNLVYQGMSAGVFSLGDEATIRAHASAIKSLTSPSEFGSPYYMPVTRDLSRGRHTLLMRFLDSG